MNPAINWKTGLAVVSILIILLLAFSPCFFPPNYLSLPKHERLIVEAAVKDAQHHLEGIWALTLRLDLVELSRAPCFEHSLLKGEAWEVRLRGYTFFYIPFCEIRVFVDGDTLTPLCGSIRPAGYKWPD